MTDILKELEGLAGKWKEHRCDNYCAEGRKTVMWECALELDSLISRLEAEASAPTVYSRMVETDLDENYGSTKPHASAPVGDVAALLNEAAKELRHVQRVLNVEIPLINRIDSALASLSQERGLAEMVMHSNGDSGPVLSYPTIVEWKEIVAKSRAITGGKR